MGPILKIDRESLFSRHRLSHQQIDDLLNENKSKVFLNEKLKLMAYTNEFLQVTQLFESENIEYINLKGPLLSLRLYNDATYRRFNDLDFLMDLASVNTAIQLLVKRGYIPVHYRWPDGKKRQRLLSRHTNQYFLYHPKKGTSIELHWRLFKYQIVQNDLLSKLISQNTIRINFQGREFTILNTELELIYLVIHGGLHAWRRLKWLVDVDEFIKSQNIDKRKFEEITDTLNAGSLVTLCNKILEINFPDSEIVAKKTSISDYLINYSLEQLILEKDVEYDSLYSFLKYISFKMRAFPGFNYKASVLKTLMFSVEDLEFKVLPSNDFVFYIFRPIGKAIRLLKHNDKSQSEVQISNSLIEQK